MTTMMPNEDSIALSSVMPLLMAASPSDLTEVQLALYLAVLHHGLANFSAVEMTPASKQTITVTADWFLNWMRSKA